MAFKILVSLDKFMFKFHLGAKICLFYLITIVLKSRLFREFPTEFHALLLNTDSSNTRVDYFLRNRSYFQ